MGLFDHFPYTNVHELNLDWVLSMMKALEAEWEAYTAGNSLTFADPLQHDISKTYAKNTIVVSASGDAYLSLQAVPTGVALSNQDYWLMVFDYEAFIEKVNKNFTARYYRGQYRATAAMDIGDWLTVDDILCTATAAIAADDLLEVGVNIDHFTLEDFIKTFMESANQTIQQYKDDIDASELAYQAAMQAEVDRILAGATVDSEVIDARTGYNGVSHTTLGNAIRDQISDLHLLTPSVLEVEFTSASQTVTTDYTVKAGERYLFYTDETYTGFFNIYVDGDSGTMVRVYSGTRAAFTPAISGRLRVYNGNSNFTGTVDIDVIDNNIFGVLSRYPITINTTAQLEEITNGTKSTDQFPPNSIVVIGTANLGLVNPPKSRELGVFISTTVTGADNANGNAQIFISNYGIETRWKTGGSWKDWKSIGSVLAPLYDSSATYHAGDFCTYQNALYRCNTEITTPESWTSAHWNNTYISEDITNCLQGYPIMINDATRLYNLTNGSNSVNDFPANKIVVVGATLAEMTEAPRSRKIGVYVTFSFNGQDNTNGCAQLFISNYGCETRWKVAGAWTEWKSFFTETFVVGTGETYTSLTKLLIDIKDDETDKIIYIKSGEYDIFNEYLDEVSDGRLNVPPDDISSGNYLYPYNAFIPNNTKVIGLGDVVLKMTPDADDVTYGESRTWSPVNVLGSVEIENIEIHAHNCRYCIHNDDKNNYAREYQVYKNVRCYYDYSDTDAQDRRLGYNMVIGFSIPDGGRHEYENCIFMMENGSNNAAFYGHDVATGDGSLYLKNCVIHSDYFTNDRTIRLQSLNHNTQNRIITTFDNCYVSGGMTLTLYYTDSKQSFDVTFKNSNKVPVTRTPAYGGTMTDIYTVKWFNPLAAPTALAPLIETDSYTP